MSHTRPASTVDQRTEVFNQFDLRAVQSLFRDVLNTFAKFEKTPGALCDAYRTVKDFVQNLDPTAARITKLEQYLNLRYQLQREDGVFNPQHSAGDSELAVGAGPGQNPFGYTVNWIGMKVDGPGVVFKKTLDKYVGDIDMVCLLSANSEVRYDSRVDERLHGLLGFNQKLGALTTAERQTQAASASTHHPVVTSGLGSSLIPGGVADQGCSSITEDPTNNS